MGINREELDAESRRATASVLRQLKADHRLSYAELSEITGMSVSALTRLMSGSRDADVAQLAKLASAWTMPFMELIQKIDNQKDFALALDRGRNAGLEMRRQLDAIAEQPDDEPDES